MNKARALGQSPDHSAMTPSAIKELAIRGSSAGLSFTSAACEKSSWALATLPDCKSAKPNKVRHSTHCGVFLISAESTGTALGEVCGSSDNPAARTKLCRAESVVRSEGLAAW